MPYAGLNDWGNSVMTKVPVVWMSSAQALANNNLLAMSWSPHGQSRQTALMWQQQPDYARYKEKLNGEGWLVNRQEGRLIQIKPDKPTQLAQFVLVSYYRLSARLGKPVRQ